MKFFNQPQSNKLIAQAVDAYSELEEAAIDNYYADGPNALNEIRTSNIQQATSMPAYSSPRPS